MHINQLGEVIRLERQRRGLTQVALAEADGVSRSCLEAIENAMPVGPGGRRSISWTEVCAILSALEIDVVLRKRGEP